jgi:4-hydroxybenzoate decarboxylase
VNSFPCWSKSGTLRIADPVKLEPDLAAATCALSLRADKARRLKPSDPFQQHLRLHQGPGRDEHARLAWPNHGFAPGLEKDAPLRDQFLEFARRHQKYPGEMEHVARATWQEVGGRPGYQPVRAHAAIPRQPRRRQLIHR